MTADGLPGEWVPATLDSVSEVTAGGSAPQESQFFGGELPFVRVSHLDVRTDAVVGCDHITPEAVAAHGLRLFPKGTIIFPKSGASVRLEKRAMLPFDSYVVSHLAAVCPDPQRVDPSFLFYALRAVRLASEKSDGYPTLRLSEIRKTRIPLPPLSEQRAIAHVLRAVQRAREQTEQVISAARQLKRSLTEQFFESSLDPWPEAALGDVVEVLDKRRVPLSAEERSGRRGPFPYCGANGVLDYIDDFLFEGEHVLLAEDGGSWGRFDPSAYLMDGRFWVNNHAHVLKANERARNRYLVQVLNYLDIASYIGGSTRGKLTQGVMKTVPIPMAPLAEQDRVVNSLETVDRKIDVEEQRRYALDMLFGSLLRDLMTARVSVTRVVPQFAA